MFEYHGKVNTPFQAISFVNFQCNAIFMDLCACVQRNSIGVRANFSAVKESRDPGDNIPLKSNVKLFIDALRPIY